MIYWGKVVIKAILVSHHAGDIDTTGIPFHAFHPAAYTRAGSTPNDASDGFRHEPAHTLHLAGSLSDRETDQRLDFLLVDMLM